MMLQRDINKNFALIFLQRLFTYFIVLRYLENKKSDDTIIASYVFPAQPEGLDAVGNIKKVIQTEPLTPAFTEETTGYTYNLKKNRLDSAGSDSFTYDNEGQLATGYGNTFTFDYEHRLTAITGAFNATYSYDGIGNRLQAVRGSATAKYIYDINGNLLAEADGSNNITRYYVHGLGLLAMVVPSMPDNVYTYHFNNIGSTIAITDGTQNIVNKYSYDPFGVILNEVEAVPQPFKYVGQWGVMHEPNGFYYMITRLLDPKAGIFTSEDTIGFAGGDANLMRYVWNRPTMFVDPLGLSNWKPVPGASGWEVRHDNYPEPHDHYRQRGKTRARKVFPNGSQVKHGEGSDEDVPQEVIEARNKKNNKNKSDEESRCEITSDANRGSWNNYGPQIVGGGLIVGGSALIIGDIILGGPTGEGIVPGLILIRRGGTAFGF